MLGLARLLTLQLDNAGGVVVLAETFSHDIYRQSLARLFELDENGHLQMYFNATLDVAVSRVSLVTLHGLQKFAVLVSYAQA